MREKFRPLLMLVAVALLLPMGEVIVLRRPLAPFDSVSIIDSFLMIFAVYWWYTLDRRDIQFRTGTFQNMGIVVFAPIAIPVYLFRSRGFVKGFLATLVALACFIAVAFLGAIGETLGQKIAL